MAAQVASAPNGAVHSKGQPPAEMVKTRKFVARAASASPKPSKAEEESLLRYLCSQVCNHQFGISINLVLLLVLTHIFFPRARRRTSKFLPLSYYNPDTDLYGCGFDDLPFVMLLVVIITGTRVAIMDYVLDPIARAAGVKSKKGLARFKEQGWLIIYYTGSWSLGMYIVYHSDFWFNLNAMWTGWPQREVNGLWKWYYLLQWASYLQQNLSVNIEEKRKDYAQMSIHHIFTSALIFLSYGFYQMRVGTVILCIMDFIDIVLPTAKLLKYTGYTKACDIAFGVFFGSWFITRHIFFNLVCWSIYAHAPVTIASGCYLADNTFVSMNSTEEFAALGGNDTWGNLLSAYIDRNGPVCWTPTFRHGFLALLISLQVLLILWFAMILKVVWRVVTGHGADDVRSDDEGEDDEVSVDDGISSAVAVEAKSGHEWAPVEQEVGVEELTFPRKSSSPGLRRSKRSSGSRSSGMSIAGHADRKELLGRIGCDKPT